MAREMGSRSQAAGTIYRVVVDQKHPDGREGTGAYGPYMNRSAAAGQRARLERHQKYYRANGWICKVYIETTAVEWQREEED